MLSVWVIVTMFTSVKLFVSLCFAMVVRLLSHVLRYDRSLPPGKIYQVLYIDDHLTVEIAKRSLIKSGTQLESDMIHNKAAQACLDSKLDLSIEKCFARQGHFATWGTTVDSASGKVGVDLQKRFAVSDLIRKAICLPFIIQSAVQNIIGAIVHFS